MTNLLFVVVVLLPKNKFNYSEYLLKFWVYKLEWNTANKYNYLNYQIFTIAKILHCFIKYSWFGIGVIVEIMHWSNLGLRLFWSTFCQLCEKDGSMLSPNYDS